MRKTTLILAFLAAMACGRAQDFLTPESYRIYDYYENGNVIPSVSYKRKARRDKLYIYGKF